MENKEWNPKKQTDKQVKGNLGNSQLCHSLGPKLLASLPSSLYFSESSSVCFIYDNVQGFSFHLAGEIGENISVHFLENRILQNVCYFKLINL